MADQVERTVGGLRLVIDRTLCVGFAQCVDASEEAFQLDDDDIAVFASPEDVSREKLVEACKACPVDALMVFDADGAQLAP